MNDNRRVELIATQQRITQVLSHVGPQTADELAERLGLARADVRQALAELAPRDKKADPGTAAHLSCGPVVPMTDRSDRVMLRGGPERRAPVPEPRSFYPAANGRKS